MFVKKRYLSSWVFTAMMSVHIRMNASLSPPLNNPGSAYDCATPTHPQTLKIKYVKTVLSKTCFQNAQKCVFLGVILNNFPGNP